MFIFQAPGANSTICKLPAIVWCRQIKLSFREQAERHHHKFLSLHCGLDFYQGAPVLLLVSQTPLRQQALCGIHPCDCTTFCEEKVDTYIHHSVLSSDQMWPIQCSNVLHPCKLWSLAWQWVSKCCFSMCSANLFLLMATTWGDGGWQAKCFFCMCFLILPPVDRSAPRLRWSQSLEGAPFFAFCWLLLI